MLWVLGAAGVVMLPTLIHGVSLGPFDVLSRSGLSKQAGVVIHNRYINDQIDAIIPWTALAWTQVHHGFLPLWNPYSALGMPVDSTGSRRRSACRPCWATWCPYGSTTRFRPWPRWSSPVRGCTSYGRVLRIGALGCTMAATVYELSGPFLGLVRLAVRRRRMSSFGWLVARRCACPHQGSAPGPG